MSEPVVNASTQNQPASHPTAPRAGLPVVALTDIRKSYGIGTAVETEVLHGIDLSIEPGEFAALIGPSGSGKSTLLNIIGLLEPATSGEYRLGGRAVTRLSDAEITAARAEALGFVFQFHHLLPAFTALENVILPALIRKGAWTAADRAHGLALLDQVGLKEAAHKRPGQLSGGMQQRVAIARALSRGSPLVLADEPTGNLDTKSADDVFALMRSFNREQGTAFLIVTHDPRLAARCDRVIELIDGRAAVR
ncbi:MAG: ABC transporter ATP-binding protein [Burkholderiales bacterium]|nr:ABC transporter ATP-binding protein [Burkholderiales bacterium]